MSEYDFSSIESFLEEEDTQSTSDQLARKTQAYLFIDPETRIRFLAEQRFPDLVKKGIDPSFKYRNINGTIYYEDPAGEKVYKGKTYKKEFEDVEGFSAFTETLVPNVVPAVTFGFDVGGGLAGAGAGFKRGLSQAPALRSPFLAGANVVGQTMAGGFIGTFLGGAVPRTARQLAINNFYENSPEENLATFNDLLISSGFGALPFGYGARGSGQVLNIFAKEPDSLRYLINLKKDKAETIKEAKEKFGIDLTLGQAEAITNPARAANLQHFLSRQPEIMQIRNFLKDQNVQIINAVETYIDALGSKKIADIGDVPTRVKTAVDAALEKISKARQERAKGLYKMIDEAPNDIEVRGMDELIDVIDDMAEGVVRDAKGKVIRTVKLDVGEAEQFNRFKKLLLDENGDPINSLQALDRRRKGSLKDFYEEVRGNSNLYPQFTGIMKNLTRLMDEAEPNYKLARELYDPVNPALLEVEKTILGKIAKYTTDKQTGNIVKVFFDPNATPDALRRAKSALLDPLPDVVAKPKTGGLDVGQELFNEMKQYFLRGKFREVLKPTNLQEGLPRFNQYLNQRKTKEMLEVMLEPEELTQLYKLNEILDGVYKISIGSSDTQPFQALKELLMKESGDIKTGSLKGIFSILNLTGKGITGKLGDKTLDDIALAQAEKYYEVLTKMILNESENVDEIFRFFNSPKYFGGQTLTRGVVEGTQDFGERTVLIKPPQPTPTPTPPPDNLLNEIEDLLGGDKTIDDKQSNLDISTQLSPTILPDEKDREIARRKMGVSGIGSLIA